MRNTVIGLELSADGWVYSPPVVGGTDSDLCPMGEDFGQWPVWCGNRRGEARYGVQRLVCCTSCGNQLARLGVS